MGDDSESTQKRVLGIGRKITMMAGLSEVGSRIFAVVNDPRDRRAEVRAERQLQSIADKNSLCL